MSKIITRFAPSPTGHLHIGGARTALFCWLLARHYGGEFRLRIEDTDTERSKQEYTDAILASMRWLGLDWDGELTYQTQRTDRYNEVIDKMIESGHAYWCSCTPEEVEAMREAARAKGEKPRYDGRCRERGLDAGPGRVVRLKIPTEGRVVFDDMVKGHIATDISELDDMILRRSDGMPTIWRWWWTTTTWGLPTSFAATTTFPTRRSRSSSIRRLGGNCPCSVTCP